MSLKPDKMQGLTPLQDHTMPLFWKPYKSDAAQFIDSLKQRDPQLEERQRQGRFLLWDRPSVDLETQKALREARVPQQPYVYQNKG